MPKVLIAAKDMINAAYASGYAACGWEVATSHDRLFTDNPKDYDLVHVLWPEALSYWRRPGAKELAEIEALLKRWTSVTPMVSTVNNFYPHRQQGDAQFKALYGMVYGSCVGLHHYSEASRRLIEAEWPATKDLPGRVTTGFSYPWLRQPEVDRAAVRADVGLAEDDFAVMVLGALRDRAELELLIRGFRASRSPNKRFFCVARYKRSRREAVRRWLDVKRWRGFLEKEGAVVIDTYVPDEQVHGLVAAGDVMVVPRVDSLNSGTPGLAMTFGKMYLAPDLPSYRDWAQGTGNLLFDPNDPASLGAAIDQAAQTDRQAVGDANAAQAATWTWERVARACLEMAGKA